MFGCVTVTSQESDGSCARKQFRYENQSTQQGEQSSASLFASLGDIV
jgi:hypothetical protein